MDKFLSFLGRKTEKLKASSGAVVACLDFVICPRNNHKLRPVHDPDLPHRIRHANHLSCSSASDLSSADCPFDPNPFSLQLNEQGILELRVASGYTENYHEYANEQLVAPNPLGRVYLGEGEHSEIAEVESETSRDKKEDQMYIGLQGRPLVARPNLQDNLSQVSIPERHRSIEPSVLDPDSYAWPPCMQGPGSPYRHIPRPGSGAVSRSDLPVTRQRQAAIAINRKPVPKPRLRKSYLRRKPLPELPSNQDRCSKKRPLRERIEDFVGKSLSTTSSSVDRISMRASLGKDILCIFAEIDPLSSEFSNNVVAKVLRGRSKKTADSRRLDSNEGEAGDDEPLDQLQDLREVIKRERMFLHISEPLLHMGEPFKIIF